MKYIAERGKSKKIVWNYRRLQIRKQQKLQDRNEVKFIARCFIEAFAEYFGEEQKDA